MRHLAPRLLGLAGALLLAEPARTASEIALVDTSGQANAVVLDGTLAYVADGLSGLRVLDLSDPAQPLEIGALTPVVLGNVGDLALDGDLVFLAEGVGGFSIVDVTDPEGPVRLANVSGLGSVGTVAASGGYAYVGANVVPGFHVYDVSDPANPVEVASSSITALPRIQLRDDVAYAGNAIVDVSDPTAPVTVATSGAFHGAFGDGFGVSTLAARVDLADPRAPVEVSSWIRPSDGPFHSDGALAGELAFLVHGTGGLSVLDASGPGPAPTLVGQTPVDSGFSDGRTIEIEGDLAYTIVNTSDDVYVVDVADPAMPAVLGFVDGSFGDVAVEGTLMATSESNSVTPGLRVWDASIPGAPIQRSFVPLPRVVQVELAGSRLYALQLNTGQPRTLHVYDVSDPLQPVALGSYQSNASPLSLHPVGTRLYVGALTGDFAGALVVLDAANPAAIVELGRVATESYAQSVVVSGQRAYVASDAVEVFDVSFPSAMQRVGRWDHPTATFRDLELEGTRVHVQSSLGWNFALDFSDPLAPRPLGALRYGSASDVRSDVELAGGLLFASGPTLRIYDGTAPTGLGVVERSREPALAGARIALDVAREIAVIASPAAGVRVVDVADDLAAWECVNGRDDDGDGLVDHGADPGCRDGGDPSERPDCADGLDDDGDGAADFPADVSCVDADEASEAANCDDGVDSDGDGLVDFGADPGCLSRLSDLEAPACQNGLDDDDDGAIDFDGGAAANGGVPLAAPDPHCNVAARNTEGAPAGGCGLGAELAPLLAALRFARGRRPSAR